MTSETAEPIEKTIFTDTVYCPCCGWQIGAFILPDPNSDPRSWQLTIRPYDPRWRLDGQETKEINHSRNISERAGLAVGAAFGALLIGMNVRPGALPWYPATDWIDFIFRLIFTPVVSAGGVAFFAFLGLAIADAVASRLEHKIRRKFYHLYQAVNAEPSTEQ